MEVSSTLETAGHALKDIFKGFTDEMQVCIQNCIQCHQVCEQMIQHCLSKGGLHSETTHIRTLQDCAQICAASADFMIRQSSLHSRTCGICAEACLACAIECELFTDDEMMSMCADVCRRCTESCRKMAARH
jgi:hypothetical protein